MTSDRMKRHYAMIGALRGELLSMRLLRADDGSVSAPQLLWKWIDDSLHMIDEELNSLRKEVEGHDGSGCTCND